MKRSINKIFYLLCIHFFATHLHGDEPLWRQWLKNLDWSAINIDWEGTFIPNPRCEPDDQPRPQTQDEIKESTFFVKNNLTTLSQKSFNFFVNDPNGRLVFLTAITLLFSAKLGVRAESIEEIQTIVSNWCDINQQDFDYRILGEIDGQECQNLYNLVQDLTKKLTETPLLNLTQGCVELLKDCTRMLPDCPPSIFCYRITS